LAETHVQPRLAIGDVAPGQAAVPHRREEPASYPAGRDRQKTRPLAGPLGFTRLCGGEDEGFTSFKAGGNLVNLIAQPAERQWSWWGRVIFYHSDVDGLYARLVAAGYRIEVPPRDAEWGERFFHITDPDGHELSFAWPLKRG
jgi:catechol 2,3-dioxygenase-like lactoylglutathione lyase family enzyme